MKNTILSVDDDPMIRNLVKVILEGEKFDVISASDGQEAFKILEEEGVANRLLGIILDVQMPGMNGFDVLTKLKIHSNTQDIPVVMLTCQSDTVDFMNGYQYGADYYITKPFTREQLLYGVDIIKPKGLARQTNKTDETQTSEESKAPEQADPEGN